MEAKMYILYKAETTVPRSEAEDGLLQPGDISERAGDRYILNAFDRREDALAALKHLPTCVEKLRNTTDGIFVREFSIDEYSRKPDQDVRQTLEYGTFTGTIAYSDAESLMELKRGEPAEEGKSEQVSFALCSSEKKILIRNLLDDYIPGMTIREKDEILPLRIYHSREDALRMLASHKTRFLPDTENEDVYYVWEDYVAEIENPGTSENTQAIWDQSPKFRVIEIAEPDWQGFQYFQSIWSSQKEKNFGDAKKQGFGSVTELAAYMNQCDEGTVIQIDLGRKAGNDEKGH